MSRPRSKKAVSQISAAEILELPIRAADGTTTAARAYELGMRQCAAKAIGGSMRHAKRFLRECLRYGLLTADDPEEHECRYRVPDEWDQDEWWAMFLKFGPPPWPGEPDGLVPLERWKPSYGTRPLVPRRRR